jgi:4a-hydroxytetrahydrobiopterin dehydratase
MTRDPLTAAEVAAALAELDGWAGDERAIHRTVTCRTFKDAVRLVGAVADIAEELDHHPDIDVRYRDVTFTSSTHTAGAVTAYDMTLARRIDAAVTLAGC